ncbi:preprotein translocase subunit YajC [Pseudokineococcus sp. 1T1Z-3]|uniref:preprotein translocase subunit YajC n=1 Tax=Pseudokineococcus sp. 1T1Z-3 TaxID=3132745 RepID=UPI0030B71DB9
METAILFLLLIPLLLIAFRGSKQRKQTAQMQASLEPGTEVMTGSGQFGYVTAVEDDRVELEIAPGITTWWVRAAVARVVEPADAEVDDEGTLDAEDDPEADPRLGAGAAPESSEAGLKDVHPDADDRSDTQAQGQPDDSRRSA